MTDGIPRAVVGDVVRRRLEQLLDPPTPAGPPISDAAGIDSDAAGIVAHRSAVLEATRRAWSFGRQHLIVVAIIALAGCLWAGYSMTSARTVPVTVTSSAAPTASVSATPSAPPPVQVHVLGAVHSPGVVRLPPGSRVQDALAAAGGLTSDARPGQLNLAAVVADGSQIVVGTSESPGGEVHGTSDAAGAGSASGGVLNLNTATVEQLDTLPGVGPVTAQAIVAWRSKHGRFSRVEELQEVDGIGPKTYAQLAPKVSV